MSVNRRERCQQWYIDNRGTEQYKKRKREWQRLDRQRKRSREQFGGKDDYVTSTSHYNEEKVVHPLSGKYNNKLSQSEQDRYNDDDDDDDWEGKTFEDYAMHAVFKHPFTMVVAGPSGSGKSCWVTRLLENKEEMIKPNVQEVIWFHGQDQESHEQLKDMFPYMQIIKGLPDVTTFDPTVPRLIIVDDLMNQLGGNVVADLFTKVSHHTNTSVILAVQNIFSRNKEMRDISLNTHYMVLMKNPRDKLQVRNLDMQMYPGKKGFLTSCYEYATRKPHGYILLTTNQSTNDMARVRTNVFPGEDNLFFGPPAREYKRR